MSFSGDLYPTAGATAVMTTTGDLVRYNAGARQRLGIGSASDVLTVSGGLPAWVAPSAGGATTTFTKITLSSNQSIATWVLTDITGMSVTVGATGKFIVHFMNNFTQSSAVAGTAVKCNIVHDATTISAVSKQGYTGSGQNACLTSSGGTCDSTAIHAESNADVSTTIVQGTSPRYLSYFWVMEIS